MPVRILVADDHPIVIAGIEKLAGDNDIAVIGALSQRDEILPQIAHLLPDVLVMETRLGGSDSLKMLEQLPAGFSVGKTVVYTAFDDPCHVARASSLGCYDFILKTSEYSELLAAIRGAAQGLPTPATSLLKTTRTRMRRSGGGQSANNPLTNREMQVLQHVSMGLSNREVGMGLGISVETVKEHVQNILRKLNVNDRTQAAVWAVRKDFI